MFNILQHIIHYEVFSVKYNTEQKNARVKSSGIFVARLMPVRQLVSNLAELIFWSTEKKSRRGSP